MKVRKAMTADIKNLTRHLQNKHIPYNTVSMMKTDVYDNNLFILTNGSTILASCAIVPTSFPWLGVKRLVVYNKKSHGKGYVQTLLNAITTGPYTYCLTPWEDNHAMRHIAEKAGFSFQYKFNDFWCCYLKNKKMKPFADWYKDVSGGDEPPHGNIPYKWFLEKNLPMIVECSCCGNTMILFNSYADEDDYTFCPSYAGIEED